MKLFNFYENDEVRLGAVCGDVFVDVGKTAELQGTTAPHCTDEVVALATPCLEKLQKLLEGELCKASLPLKFAPCVVAPQKIVCVGMNYKSHDEECNFKLPTEPILFGKFNNALAAHEETIPLPQTSQKCDYEAELVVVIGKKAKNVSRQQALDCVFGYTIGNDLSARDLQFRVGQWLVGKNPDKFAPIGPCIVTADEISPNSLNICCKLNGEVRQSANTREMIFDCAEIVHYASQTMTLQPGDVIFTGTPSGVIYGKPQNEQCWLTHGDCIEVSIEGIGTLKNTIE